MATTSGAHCAFLDADAEKIAAIRKVTDASKAENEPMIAKCKATAAEVQRTLQSAIDSGRITVDDMFDNNYEYIEGTDPPQYMTRYLALTDEVLPPIQEPALASDPRIQMFIAMDRNGLIGTNNLKVSKPQRPGDPVWNAANCRNRRLYHDRAGMAAGANTRPHLIQSYIRDMGGGKFVALKEVCCPIILSGRLWGNMRLAFKS